MNQHPLHIKRCGYCPAVLTFFLLFAVVQSQAQRHPAHRRHARHAVSMPDSVNTADEEIKPFVSDTIVSSGNTGAPPEQNVETPASGNTDQAAASPDSEAKEPPLVLRDVPDSVIARRKKERDFAYANDPSWWNNNNDDDERRTYSGSSLKPRSSKDSAEQRTNDPARSLEWVLGSKVFQYFIYIFLGAVLLYALYKIIAENNLRFFYRTPSRAEEGSPEEAALPEESLDQLLKKALDGKEHRMAVRYLYLKTLRMLEARQLIRWHIRTTDEEYARQLDKLPQGAGFRWLMNAYERVWYGKFPLNDQQFARLLQYFQDFHTSIDQSRRA